MTANNVGALAADDRQPDAPPTAGQLRLRASTSVLAGHPLTVTYSVENTGSGHTPNVRVGPTRSTSRRQRHSTRARRSPSGTETHYGTLRQQQFLHRDRHRDPTQRSERLLLRHRPDRQRGHRLRGGQANNVLATASPSTIASKPADLASRPSPLRAPAQAGGVVNLVTWTVVNQGTRRHRRHQLDRRGVRLGQRGPLVAGARGDVHPYRTLERGQLVHDHRAGAGADLALGDRLFLRGRRRDVQDPITGNRSTPSPRPTTPTTPSPPRRSTSRKSWPILRSRTSTPPRPWRPERRSRSPGRPTTTARDDQREFLV